MFGRLVSHQSGGSHAFSNRFRDRVPRCKRASRHTGSLAAKQTWDMATYMTDAQIDILRDGQAIASANYHLKGGGGLITEQEYQAKRKELISKL